MDEKKINYYLLSLLEIEKIKQSGKRPSLLLHACCGPCAAFPLTFLCPIFDVTIMYNNSNIYPKEEYDRRIAELRKLLKIYKDEFNFDIKLVEPPYDNDFFSLDLEPYKDQDEGKTRCVICYQKRMKEAYDFAENNKYDYFTTVMTISRQKDSQILNRIGKSLSETHLNTKYLFSDFKKNKGIDIARDLRIKYKLYQQLYCGCKYTYQKGLKKAEEKLAENLQK
jgi:epoxyqueuosine reductase